MKIVAFDKSVTRPLTNEPLSHAPPWLATRDRHLCAIHRTHGTPPMWGRRPGFPTLIRIVLEQQVSLISARAMFERLKTNIDPLIPEAFIERGEEYLRSLGMTRQKAHYAIQLAEAFQSGHLKSVAKLTDDEARAVLTSIKGVGAWTD